MFAAIALAATIFAQCASASPSSSPFDPWGSLPAWSKCADHGPISCQNTTVQADSCCYNYPGGLFLSTQLWYYTPDVGPKDVWTLHGLWPDNCDLTYSSSCDPSRNVYNVTEILKQAGEYELLGYMNKFWLNNTGPNELLWEHEWNKHGTCISTLEPSCFTTEEHSKSYEVIAYIKRIVGLYRGLPTYEFLARQNIVPTTHHNYTLVQVQNALLEATGFNASVVCDTAGRITQVYYNYEIQGSLVDGKFHGTSRVRTLASILMLLCLIPYQYAYVPRVFHHRAAQHRSSMFPKGLLDLLNSVSWPLVSKS
ncbi:ribonuclease T2 [Clavulina sp. PMI_390]|nr:ribonuclease T2 [Clavulina sp. PMI_390]